MSQANAVLPTKEYTRQTLDDVARNDVQFIWQKDQSYGRSWKKRGGVGAFMMLARKWDRIENMLSAPQNGAFPYDIFEVIHAENGSGADGMMLAEVQDLRRYLLLVEAHMIAVGVVAQPLLKHVVDVDDPRAKFRSANTNKDHEEHPRGFDKDKDAVG